MIIKTRIEFTTLLKFIFGKVYISSLGAIAVYSLWITAVISPYIKKIYYIFITISFIVGIYFLIVKPISIYFKLKKSFKIEIAHQYTEYEFTDEKIMWKKKTCSGTMELNSLYTIQEYKNWFVLFSGRNTYYSFIPKKNMTPSQIEELRSIFRSTKGVKLKLL
jgi:hypothetical protein